MSEGKTPPPAGSAGFPADRQRQRERQQEHEPMSQPAIDMRVDAALAEWPSVEKSPIEWDEAAERVMDRIATGDRGKSIIDVSDEALFAPPLADEPSQGKDSPASGRGRGAEGPPSVPGSSEVSKMGQSSERRRDRQSLQELAKLASTIPPSSKRVAQSGVHPAVPPSQPGIHKEDSGLLRVPPPPPAQSAPRAPASLFDDEPLSAPMPPVSARASAPPAPPAPPSQPIAAAPAVPSVAPQQPTKKGGSGVFFLVGGVVTALAVAAGVVFVIKSKTPQQTTAQNNTAIVQPEKHGNAANTAQTPPPPPSEKGVDPGNLPQANHGQQPHAPTAPLAVLPPGQKPLASVAPTTTTSAPPAPTTTATTEEKKVETPPATANNGDKSLEQQIRDAVPNATPTQTPAAQSVDNGTQGSVPLKPSQGAVQGAIGAVMPAARSCLGPDDPISRATIVFQSNGSVQSVSISGGAQGKPAEACIRVALMRAKVAPFAQPTFTAGATIRSN